MKTMNTIKYAALVSGALLTLPLADRLRADEAPCAVVSAGAETDAATGSAQNVGQAVIGRADNGAVFMHAGGIPCFQVRLTCTLGDLNGDGTIDGLDIAPYVVVTITGIGTPRELCAAGIDMLTFVALLLGL
jgi:hypothetical protein